VRPPPREVYEGAGGYRLTTETLQVWRASTSSRTSPSKSSVGVHPSRARALEESPSRSCSSAVPLRSDSSI
jgi:hypothetical protein